MIIQLMPNRSRTCANLSAEVLLVVAEGLGAAAREIHVGLHVHVGLISRHGLVERRGRKSTGHLPTSSSRRLVEAPSHEVHRGTPKIQRRCPTGTTAAQNRQQKRAAIL